MSDRFQRGAYQIVMQDELEGATPHDCDTGMTCCDGCAHTGHMFQDLPDDHDALAQQAQPLTDEQIEAASQIQCTGNGSAHRDYRNAWKEGARWMAQQVQPNTYGHRSDCPPAPERCICHDAQQAQPE